MSAAPVLIILRNGETIKSHSLEGEAVLGRAEGCVIRLDDRAISRQHAVFKPVADGVQIEKKSEFAPLMVNGAETTRAIVKEGDVISIGPYLMKLSMPKESVSAKPAAAVASEAALPQESEAGPAEVGQDLAGALDLDSPQQDAESAESGEAQAEQDPFASPDAGGGLDFSSDPVADPSSSPIQAEEMEMADDDAKTKLTPMAKLAVRLLFEPGTANVAEFELTQDEISIGRGQGCDVVLNDKKSSRKNSIIRRAGLSFVIKDLDSANGTFVNGVRVDEQELSGGDVIKVGSIEFVFEADSAEYAARAKDFSPVSEDPEAADAAAFDADPNGLGFDGAGVGQEFMAPVEAGDAIPGVDPGAQAIPGMDPGAGIPGITGIDGAGGKKKTLLEKYRALPKNKQIIYGVLAAVLLYLGVFDDDEPGKDAKKPKPRPSAVASATPKGSTTFDSLPAEQKRFVESQHALAFDYYRNQDYDKALFEIEKIFVLIEDYKDSRDIQRYAKEGKRKWEAIEEEKRRKEEEARLKSKITQLVEETRERMGKKQFDQAQELFPQILSLDPDNAEVGKWRKEIEDFEEQKRIGEQQKSVQIEINKKAWEIYQEGLELKRAGKFRAAIPVFEKVADIGASDPKPLRLAKKMIQACLGAIRDKREPVLKEAKQLEEQGEFAKAYKLFDQATKIDPPHPEGYAGIRRVKGVLRDRAKMLYTEAVLAESYSDFAVAKKKFKECLETAPTDDIYHDRAARKLAHYFRKDDP